MKDRLSWEITKFSGRFLQVSLYLPKHTTLHSRVWTRWSSLLVGRRVGNGTVLMRLSFLSNIGDFPPKNMTLLELGARTKITWQPFRWSDQLTKRLWISWEKMKKGVPTRIISKYKDNIVHFVKWIKMPDNTKPCACAKADLKSIRPSASYSN